MKVVATKIFTFDMAHTLTGHAGKCQNLHGHTYKLEITVSRYNGLATAGRSAGMVIDFSDLKQLVEREIIDKVDHVTMIYPCNDFEKQLLQLLKEHNKAVAVVPYRPTAENMAKDFAERLQSSMQRNQLPIKIEKIKLWETPTSFAEVFDFE